MICEDIKDFIKQMNSVMGNTLIMLSKMDNNLMRNEFKMSKLIKYNNKLATVVLTVRLNEVSQLAKFDITDDSGNILHKSSLEYKHGVYDANCSNNKLKISAVKDILNIISAEYYNINSHKKQDFEMDIDSMFIKINDKQVVGFKMNYAIYSITETLELALEYMDKINTNEITICNTTFEKEKSNKLNIYTLNGVEYIYLPLEKTFVYFTDEECAKKYETRKFRLDGCKNKLKKLLADLEGDN